MKEAPDKCNHLRHYIEGFFVSIDRLHHGTIASLIARLTQKRLDIRPSQ